MSSLVHVRSPLRNSWADLSFIVIIDVHIHVLNFYFLLQGCGFTAVVIKIPFMQLFFYGT